MAAQTIMAIPLENLLVDQDNPRHAPQPSQRQALAAIAQERGEKLTNLAADIWEKGLNPSDLPLVTYGEQDGRYVVVEGNRRICALKLMASPQLLASLGLPKKMNDRFKEIVKSPGEGFPPAITCSVVLREDANHWIRLKHTGENEGVGVVTWDGRARQRFRGSSPALQAIELVEKSSYIDDETRKKLDKIYITNVERVLATPEARKLLGVEVKNGQLTLKSPEEEALGRLAILVGEVANRAIKVTGLDTKDQRVAYAENIAAMPLPTVGGGTEAGNATGTTNSKGGARRRINPDRKALIPRTLKLAIPHARINRIYSELQKLSVEDYVNCCAVMFRVFVELSIDHYAQQKGLSLTYPLNPRPGAQTQKPVDMKLRDKIATAADHLERNHVCNADQLKGIRVLARSHDDHILSVDTLHAAVHNKDFNPTPTDLKANWDSIQPFVEALWAV